MEYNYLFLFSFLYYQLYKIFRLLSLSTLEFGKLYSHVIWHQFFFLFILLIVLFFTLNISAISLKVFVFCINNLHISITWSLVNFASWFNSPLLLALFFLIDEFLLLSNHLYLWKILYIHFYILNIYFHIHLFYKSVWHFYILIL